MDDDHRNTENDDTQINLLLRCLGSVVSVNSYYLHSYDDVEPCRTGALSGQNWVNEVLQGHEIRCHEQFRMNVHVFNALCSELMEKYMLVGSSNIKVPEMVAMFLYTLSRPASNRDVQERFQHSGETVSRIFNKVLHAICGLATNILKPRNNQFLDTPAYIRGKQKFMPFFKNCIGAIDGTHIPAVVNSEHTQRFINRKGVTTQNIMAACDFDMFYIFISAGWEGSAHDARIFHRAITNPNNNFPIPPPGKYYLVDAGYPNKAGFIAPYRGERYHNSQFRGAGGPRGKKEKFNKRHSGLRSVIERCFGVTKKKWKILHSMPSYPYRTQVKIIVCCFALHNFVRLHSQYDPDFAQAEDDSNFDVEDSDTGDIRGSSTYIEDDNEGTRIREEIADAIWHDTRH